MNTNQKVDSGQIRTDVVRIIVDLGIFLGGLKMDHHKPSRDEEWAVRTAERYWPDILFGIKSAFDVKPGDTSFVFVRKQKDTPR